MDTQGAIGYDADLTSPTTWSDGSSVELRKGSKHLNFHLIVPDGQVLPTALRMRSTVLALDDPATIAAGSIPALQGRSATTPFGSVSVTSVSSTKNTLTIEVTIPSNRVSPGLTAQGAEGVTLIGGERTVRGLIAASSGVEHIAFPAPPASGPVTLRLELWRFAVNVETVLPVPPGLC